MSASCPRIRLLIMSGTLAGGGAERFISNLIGNLSLDSFAPSLCLMRSRIEYSLPTDVPVFNLDHQGPSHLGRTIRRLRNVIEETEPDLILSNLDWTGQYVGEALVGSDVQPIWIARTSNSPDQTFRGLRGKILRMRLSRVYPRADFFIANSHGLANRFVQTFSCARNRIRVIGNPVDIEGIHRLALDANVDSKPKGKPTLIWYGRFYPQKRLDILLDAFHKIRACRSAHLLICGSDGPLKTWVARRIRRLKLTNSTTQLPFQRNPFPLVRQADLALSTSDYEGLSNSVLEAQSLGVPVVATRCEFGNSEIVADNETGLLTERGDANAVAEAAVKLLNDPELRAVMRSQALKRTRQLFDTPIIMRQWEHLFHEVGAMTISGRPQRNARTRAA